MKYSFHVTSKRTINRKKEREREKERRKEGKKEGRKERDRKKEGKEEGKEALQNRILPTAMFRMFVVKIGFCLQPCSGCL